MNIFGWILTFFGSGYAGLGALATAVRDGLWRLASGFIGVFVGWFTEAAYVARAAIALLYAFVGLGAALGGALGRLALVALPNLVEGVISTTFHYVEQQALQAYHYAEYLVGQARSDVSAWVNGLKVWAQQQLTALIDHINAIVTLLNTVAGRVFALLTDPQALADWIGGHIVGSVYRWALGNAEAFARLALNGAVGFALKGASVIERIIADLFL